MNAIRSSLAAAAACLLGLAALPLHAEQPLGSGFLPATQGPAGSATDLDRDGDGKVDYRVLYDARGRVLQEELDFNFDGRTDTFFLYKNGILQEEDIDYDTDGKIDIWVYILDGTWIRRWERDTNGDGKPDIVRDYSGS